MTTSNTTGMVIISTCTVEKWYNILIRESKSNKNESCNTYTETVKNNVSEHAGNSCGSEMLKGLKSCGSEKLERLGKHLRIKDTH